MRNIKIIIEYDGTNFRGWQIQSQGKRTVQGEIAKALRVIFGKKITLIGSGRTDSGVHAIGQVANFKTDSLLPTQKIVRALNANIPDDIVILGAQEMPSDFHAQFSAKGKLYRYTILNRQERAGLERNFVFHFPHPLDANAMRQAAHFIKGTHDFRSFTATDPAERLRQEKSTVRTISGVSITQRGDFITIDISSNGFLYKMVRNIVGTLLDVGVGKIAPEKIKKIISAKNRSAASTTAPAHGLCLIKVKY